MSRSHYRRRGKSPGIPNNDELATNRLPSGAKRATWTREMELQRKEKLLAATAKTPEEIRILWLKKRHKLYKMSKQYGFKFNE